MKRIFTVSWEVTNKCNLRCSHCYNYLKDDKSSKEQKIKISKQISEKLDPLLVIIGGGEPFKCEVLEEIFENITENCMLAIATNGTYIDFDLVKGYSDYIRYIQVSIDGPKKIHNELRDPSYYEAVSSIERLNDIGIDTLINMTLSEKNYEYISDMLDLANSLNSNLKLSSIKPVGNYIKNISNLKEISSHVEKYKEDVILDSILSTLLRDNFECKAAKEIVCIKENGSIIPCPWLRNEVIADIINPKRKLDNEIERWIENKHSKDCLLLNDPNYVEF